MPFKKFLLGLIAHWAHFLLELKQFYEEPFLPTNCSFETGSPQFRKKLLVIKKISDFITFRHHLVLFIIFLKIILKLFWTFHDYSGPPYSYALLQHNFNKKDHLLGKVTALIRKRSPKFRKAILKKNHGPVWYKFACKLQLISPHFSAYFWSIFTFDLCKISWLNMKSCLEKQLKFLTKPSDFAVKLHTCSDQHIMGCCSDRKIFVHNFAQIKSNFTKQHSAP